MSSYKYNMIVLCDHENDWGYYMKLGDGFINKTKVVHKPSQMLSYLERSNDYKLLILDYETMGINTIVNIISKVNKEHPYLKIIALTNTHVDSFTALNTIFDKDTIQHLVKPISKNRITPVIKTLKVQSLKEEEARQFLVKNLNKQGSKQLKNRANRFWKGLSTSVKPKNKETINIESIKKQNNI